jgi:sortase A
VASRSRSITRLLLFLGGVLLLAKGSFSVYPFLLSSKQSVEIEIRPTPFANGLRFEPGEYLFRLSLPRQGANLSVVEGTTEAALREGAGHLEGSPLPGFHGNAIIAGHRDTYFRVLKDVSIGDEIWIEIGRRQYIYQIVDTRVVAPEETSSIQPESEETLTLITCYPFYHFGPAPKRFIVRARAIEQ